MAGGAVLLGQGQEIVIQREPIEGTTNRISTTLGELVDDVKPGEAILLDDGKIQREVLQTRPPDEILCKVLLGGILGSGKGVNLPGTNLRLSALTEKDRRDVEWIARRDFDYVALSFVQRADDILTLRELLQKHHSQAHIIAKIEKPQALEDLDNIVSAADAVMVARGDLGVEMPLPAVPVAQKRITALAQKMGKPCIIATQMLESMISAPTPTRAEVSDIANAVLDHADAVMLSGETAVGKYPARAVAMMNQTVEAIQAYHDNAPYIRRIDDIGSPTTTAIAAAVREIIREEDIKAVALFTATGDTARAMAKTRLPRPVLALAQNDAVVRRMCLYYGVISRQAQTPTHTRDLLNEVSGIIVELDLAKTDDRLVVVSGRPLCQPGRTNTIVVHTVGASPDME
jgi:pyruvate kinase